MSVNTAGVCTLQHTVKLQSRGQWKHENDEFHNDIEHQAMVSQPQSRDGLFANIMQNAALTAEFNQSVSHSDS